MKRYFIAVLFILITNSFNYSKVVEPNNLSSINKVVIIGLSACVYPKNVKGNKRYNSHTVDSVYMSFALGKATEAFTEIGWETPDPYTYIDNSTFQQFKKDMDKSLEKQMSKIRRDWNFYDDLAKTKVSDSKEEIALMSDIANKLGVDAVVVVQIELCVRVKPNEKRSSSVPYQASVGMGLKIVSKDGNYIVLDDVTSVEKEWNTEFYLESYNNIINFYSPESRRAFFKSTELAANKLVSRFKK